MPTRRYYANSAPQLQLAVPLTSGGTTLTIGGSFVGWPTSFPYFATLDRGTAAAEIVSVTAAAGTIATVVRAQDGTSAISHPSGSTLDMTVVRQDMDEANAHIVAASGVHGRSGALVGTTDTQTLSNKTFTGTTVLAGVTQSGTAGLSGPLNVGGQTTVQDLSVTGALTAPGGTVALANLSVPGLATISNLTVAGASVAAMGRGLLAEHTATTQTVALSTVFTRYVDIWAPAVFTLTSTRRVRIYVAAQFLASTSVDTAFTLYGGYNTGGTVTGPTSGTTLEDTRLTTVTVDATYASGLSHEGTVLLTAGTYTAYPVAYRSNGATGNMVGGYCAVYDVGNV